MLLQNVFIENHSDYNFSASKMKLRFSPRDVTQVKFHYEEKLCFNETS